MVLQAFFHLLSCAFAKSGPFYPFSQCSYLDSILFFYFLPFPWKILFIMYIWGVRNYIYFGLYGNPSYLWHCVSKLILWCMLLMAIAWDGVFTVICFLNIICGVKKLVLHTYVKLIFWCMSLMATAWDGGGGWNWCRASVLNDFLTRVNNWTKQWSFMSFSISIFSFMFGHNDHVFQLRKRLISSSRQWWWNMLYQTVGCFDMVLAELNLGYN